MIKSKVIKKCVRIQEIINQKWDKSNYKKYSHIKPLFVKTLDKSIVDKPKEDVLDLCIKDIGTEEYDIPENLIGKDEVAKILSMVDGFERKINSDIKNWYTYITINQGFVEAGTSQRNGGIHFDGMQGWAYKNNKLNTCHQYVVSSSIPTRFHLGKFETDRLNELKHNFFTAFQSQINNDKGKFKIFEPKPYDIHLMTAYSVHEAVVSEERKHRTFIRIEYTQKRADRIGNTINPLISKNWNWGPRPIPEHLI